MTKFLYLFRGGDNGSVELSPEERQAHMGEWKTWMGALAQNGTLVDGLPLSSGGKMVRDSGTVVTDGPFTEGKEIVGGYLIVNAEDIDNAVEISKGCPVFSAGGNVEVREILGM